MLVIPGAALGWQNLSNCVYESSLARGAVPSSCDRSNLSACGAPSGRGACTPISTVCEEQWDDGSGDGQCSGCFWLALEQHVDPSGAVCRCAGHFDGAACEVCSAGWRGERCSVPVAPLVRRNARAWSADDAARFGRGFEASLLADDVSRFQHASQVSGDNLGRTATMGECIDMPADPHRTPLEGGSLYALHWHRPVISWVEQGLARDGLLPEGVGMPMWDVRAPPAHTLHASRALLAAPSRPPFLCRRGHPSCAIAATLRRRWATRSRRTSTSSASTPRWTRRATSPSRRATR